MTSRPGWPLRIPKVCPGGIAKKIASTRPAADVAQLRGHGSSDRRWLVLLGRILLRFITTTLSEICIGLRMLFTTLLKRV